MIKAIGNIAKEYHSEILNAEENDEEIQHENNRIEKADKEEELKCSIEIKV